MTADLSACNRPQLEGIAGKFEDKPLIGFVSTLIHDYMPLVDDYYFCASPSSSLALSRADVLPKDTS